MIEIEQIQENANALIRKIRQRFTWLDDEVERVQTEVEKIDEDLSSRRLSSLTARIALGSAAYEALDELMAQRRRLTRFLEVEPLLREALERAHGSIRDEVSGWALHQLFNQRDEQKRLREKNPNVFAPERLEYIELQIERERQRVKDKFASIEALLGPVEKSAATRTRRAA